MQRSGARILLSCSLSACLGILTAGTWASWIVDGAFNPIGALVNCIGCVCIVAYTHILIQ